MDTTKFTMGIVGLVVIILMVTGAVLPAVEDAQHQARIEIGENTGGIYTIYAGPESVTLTLDDESDGCIAINGVVDTQPYQLYVDRLFAKNLVLGVVKDEQDHYSWSGRFVDPTDVTLTVSASRIVYSNGTVTGYQSDEIAFTTESDFIIYPNSKGSYVQYNLSNESTRNSVHINSDATVYVVGFGGQGYTFFEGNLNNGFEWVGLYGSWFDSATLNYTTVESEDGLSWTFGSNPTITFTDSTEQHDPPTYTQDQTNVYVPIKYNYAVEENDMSALIGIIPLLLIIVAVLYAVRLMGASRN